MNECEGRPEYPKGDRNNQLIGKKDWKNRMVLKKDRYNHMLVTKTIMTKCC